MWDFFVQNHEIQNTTAKKHLCSLGPSLRTNVEARRIAMIPITSLYTLSVRSLFGRIPTLYTSADISDISATHDYNAFCCMREPAWLLESYIITIKRCLNNLSFWSEWSPNSTSNTFIRVMANIYFLKSLAFQWSKWRSTTSVPCFKNGWQMLSLFRWTDSTCEVGICDASWINVVDVHPGFVSKNYTPVGLVGEVTKLKIQETSMFCRMHDFHRGKENMPHMRVSDSQ